MQLCYPKPTDKALYNGLVTQCCSLGLKFLPAEEVTGAPLPSRFDLVVDAIFGFSFKGSPRPPFDTMLAALSTAAAPPPIVSVDIPSGWDVEDGDSGEGLRPDMLVSLTAPKRSATPFPQLPPPPRGLPPRPALACLSASRPPRPPPPADAFPTHAKSHQPPYNPPTGVQGAFQVPITTLVDALCPLPSATSTD